jgi:hypothetical protein
MDAVNAHLNAFLRERSAYCHRCGASLIYKEIGRAKVGGAIYHISCPNCGFENKAWNASEGSSSPIVAVPIDSKERPPDIPASLWQEMSRRKRLDEMSVSEKIQRLTIPVFVFSSLQPRLLLSSYWFGEGVKHIGLLASLMQKLRVLTRMVREGLRKGENRAIRMSEVLRADYAQREGDARYVEFHASYEGPEYDAAIEKIQLKVHDRRAPRGFGTTTTIHNTIRGQLINFVPYGPPGAFQVNFRNEMDRYFNLFAIQNAPVTQIETSLISGESVRWDIRRIDFPAPLAHVHTLIGDSELMIAAVGPIVDDLESVLPTLVRLEPESAEAAMLGAGRSAFSQHRMKKAREHQQDKSPDQP